MQFELLYCIIKVNKISTRVVVVYKPPPPCNNELRYEDFALKWSSYIEQFVEVREELLIVGDFNIMLVIQIMSHKVSLISYTLMV